MSWPVYTKPTRGRVVIAALAVPLVLWVVIKNDATSSPLGNILVGLLIAAVDAVYILFYSGGKPRPKVDQYQVLVWRAVQATRSEDEAAITEALLALNNLAADEVLAELLVWVEDVTRGKDVDELLAAARLPLPADPKTLVDAVLRTDVKAMNAYAGHEFPKLLASLLALVASLQEAGERV